MENRIGLALGGGGARGSYQIGIVKALHEIGLLKQITHVSGTSIGAINTLMVMADYSYDRMIDVWQKIKNQDIYGAGPDRLKIDKLGLFSLQDVFIKLSQEVKLSEIRESKMKGFATVAKIHKESLIDQVLLHRMKKEVFNLNETKDPHRAVLASASIPLIFGSTKIGDDSYVDGGAVDNYPIQPLIDAGCNIIFVVPLDHLFSSKKFADQNILLINLETHLLFKTISADILDFNPEMVKDNAEYGYKMGMAMVDKLQSLGFMDDQYHLMKPEGYRLIQFTKIEETNLNLMEVNDGS
ncbi:MAG: patatin-like phospholipase family protein [Acholeplasmataceae bacterium]